MRGTMHQLEVRELKAGEEQLWLALDDVVKADEGQEQSGDADKPTASELLKKFRKVFAECSASDPRTFLIALEGERPVGRLLGLFLDAGMYYIQELTSAEGIPCSPIEDALVDHLAESFSREGIGIMSWDRARSAEVNSALDRAGFTVGKQKAFVSRSLKADLPAPKVEFTFRSLFEVEKPEFLRVMTEASEGDPFEDADNRDPEAEFAELVEAAGSKFDPADWLLAYIEDEAVGTVLPQEFADTEGEGTLFYVAVLPHARGRGYGRALHAKGLSLLAERGVTRYIGSTDMRNTPMLKVFEANGCPQTGTQLFFVPPPCEPPPR